MSTEQAAAVALAVAAAVAAAAAGKGLKGAKAAKKTKPRKSNGLVDAERKSGSKTGTVWDNITPTQENYPYTNIPKSFEVEVYGEKLTQGNLEFIFAQPRQAGQLSVIKHAQFNGWH